MEWKQMSKCHELSGTEIFFPLIRTELSEKLSFWQHSSIISTNLSLFTANEAWIKALLSVLCFVERFSLFYLGCKRQGASMTWINGLAAGEHRVAAAPPEACLAGTGWVHCTAGQSNAGAEGCSHLPQIIYTCLVNHGAILGLDHLF